MCVVKLNTEQAVEGWFSVEKFKVDSNGNEIEGSRHKPVPDFRNLITNAGLDRMGAYADWLWYCQVGSGSTIANVSDTTLAARVGSASGPTPVQAMQSTAPYYISATTTYRFAIGTAVGNLSEVGVGWAETGSLFSRALIVDGSGVPTTITVLPDEILDVTYQFRCYAPTADVMGTIVLRGVTHTWTSRAAMVTSMNIYQGWYMPRGAWLMSNPGVHQATDGTIGPVTGAPTGDVTAASSISDAAYSSGSYAREGTLTFGLNQANYATGIGAIITVHGIGVSQISFSPKIMKTSEDVLTLVVKHSWARKTL